MFPPRTYRVLTGPTASGKTDWLLRRSQSRPLAVISADSRQIYRFMDIGTGKVPASFTDSVPHFGLDLFTPSEKYSVYQYFHDVSQWFEQLEDFEGEVWLAGGTGLYIRAITEGLELGAPPLTSLRPHLEEVIRSQGAASLATSLDLELPDPHNPHRVLRAVEVALRDPEKVRRTVHRLQIDLTEILEAGPIAGRQSQIGWQCAGIAVLDPGREELNIRIGERVRGMFEAGLVEETARLRHLSYGDSTVVKRGIGYAEAIAVLAAEMQLEQAIERTVLRTRQYAKRQRTYFRGRGWPFYSEDALPFD